MKHIAKAALLTLFLVTPAALAQDGTTSDSTAGTTGTTGTTTTTHDYSGLWGLVGLVGLAGLAGLRRQPTTYTTSDRNVGSGVRP